MLRFENKGVELHFDDYDIREDGSAWSRICAYCRVRYAHVLENRPDQCGEAMGTCGIYGCGSEADDYVDFAADEVAEVTEHPAVSNKYTVFEDAETAARHLLSTIQKGRVYSIYGWDNRDGRWSGETVVAKVPMNGFEVIVANSRYGVAPYVCETVDVYPNLVENFTNYLVEKVGAPKYAIVSPVEMDVRYGLEEQIHQLRSFPGKLSYGNYDLQSVPLSAFAEWLANQDSNDSVVGFAVDFLMEGNRTINDTWFRTALFPLGDCNIAVVSDGNVFAALTQRNGFDVGSFAAAFTATIRTVGFHGDDVMLPPVVAGWVRATMKKTMDADTFMDYIKEKFTVATTTLRIIENILTYTELFDEPSDKWDIIETLLDGTGITLTRAEIEMFNN